MQFLRTLLDLFAKLVCSEFIHLILIYLTLLFQFEVWSLITPGTDCGESWWCSQRRQSDAWDYGKEVATFSMCLYEFAGQDFWSWGGTTRKFQGICQAFWLYQLGQSHSLLWVGVFCFGISTITIWCSFYIHLSGIEHPWNQQCCFDFIFYYIPVISIITWGSVLRVVGRVPHRATNLIQVIQNLSQRSFGCGIWKS